MATIKPMTNAPETSDINRLPFLALISGTCVMQISDWIIPVPDTGAD